MDWTCAKIVACDDLRTRQKEAARRCTRGEGCPGKHAFVFDAGAVSYLATWCKKRHA